MVRQGLSAGHTLEVPIGTYQAAAKCTAAGVGTTERAGSEIGDERQFRTLITQTAEIIR